MRRVTAGQIAWSEPLAGPLDTDAVSTLSIATRRGDAQTVAMVYSGRPIGQPVAIGGPFVMNTRTEIDQAFRDYRAGKFGAVPRTSRLPQLTGRTPKEPNP